MIYIVYALHIVTCIFLILVVLLQQGKGADLSVFGGGSTQAAFGARGAATLLHKLTVAFFILFMVTTVSIGVLQRGRRASSVMQGVAAQPATSTQPAPAPPAEGGPAEAAAEAAPVPQGEAAAQPGAANGDAAGSAPQSQAPARPGDAAPPPPPSDAAQPQSP